MSDIRESSLAADSDSQDDPRIVAAVKSFMDRLDAGEVPVIADFLRENADIATQLRPVLEGLALVHGAARPKRTELAIPSDAEFTAKPIGDFQVVRELGRGGMGVVYEAIQLSLGRRVALKVLPFASGLDASRLQRFRNEAHAAAQLHHTNIVPVYAVGSDRGVQYYAMQLIEGQSLAELIEGLRRANTTDGAVRAADGRQQPAGDHGDRLQSTTEKHPAGGRSTTLLSDSGQRSRHYRSMVQLAHQATLALEHAHQYGVVHRDIKPGNLLLDEKQKLWVTDFGLAQIEHAESRLTRSGDALGTIRYMSPEQAAGNRVVLDHRTDVYSLGVTLYEMLTLQPAIRGQDYRDMLNQVAEHDPLPPRAIDAGLPIELDTIIRKAIAKDPTARYATAQAFGDDLLAWLDDKPIAAKPPTLWQWLGKWRKRNRRLVNIAAVLLVAACVGLLATTLVVLREQNRTRQALERESSQRAIAEARFQQARRAVDTFSELSETELAYRPEFQDLRRRILETSLEFYREFLTQRAANPTEARELMNASAKVERMVEELKLLEDVAPLLLLADPRVRRELAIEEDKGQELIAEIDRLQSARANLGEENWWLHSEAGAEIPTRLRDFVHTAGGALDPMQLNRLRQIVRQQQLPFTFLTLEASEHLQLSSDQRQAISKIIQEERPNRGGPPGERPGRDRPPHGPGQQPPPPPRFSRENRPPDDDPRRDGADRPGPPWADGDGRGRFDPRPDMQLATQRTVERILKMLTAEQLAKWKEFIGPPFAHRWERRPGSPPPARKT